MIKKLIFIFSLLFFLILTNLLALLKLDVLFVETLIIAFFFLNREYLKKFKKHAPEKIIFNYYTIISLVFLLIKSYFTFTSYTITFLCILVLILYLLSDYCEEKINIVFLGVLIFFFLMIYVSQMIEPLLMLDNYYLVVDYKMITYVIINIAIDVSFFLIFVKLYKKILSIDEDH